ncbi:hypothetical protein BO71DRAFT_332959, partial [Aspergillus ellipticus CBS 707.79]
VQASAVPIFLKVINLAKSYFIYKTGEICYILIMVWGDKSIYKIERDKMITREVARSEKEIYSLEV